jgi:anti-anti-sigma factor
MSSGWRKTMDSVLPDRSPVPLDFRTGHPAPGTVRIAVTGEIDLATAGRFRTEILTVLAASRPRHVEIELGAVSFLDCTGISALVVAGRAAAGAGCRLRIINPPGVVRRILALTGMLDSLTAGLETPVPAPSSGPFVPGPRAGPDPRTVPGPDPCGAGALLT